MLEGRSRPGYVKNTPINGIDFTSGEGTHFWWPCFHHFSVCLWARLPRKYLWGNSVKYTSNPLFTRWYAVCVCVCVCIYIYIYTSSYCLSEMAQQLSSLVGSEAEDWQLDCHLPRQDGAKPWSRKVIESENCVSRAGKVMENRHLGNDWEVNQNLLLFYFYILFSSWKVKAR